jgi:hypothetical protein
MNDDAKTIHARFGRRLPLRPTALAAVLALLAAPCLLAPAAGAATLSPGPGRLSLEFRPLGKKSEAWGRRVWEDGFLKTGIERLNETLTLPRNVTVVVRPGESLDAPPTVGEPLILGYANPAEVKELFEDWGVLTRGGKRVIPAKDAEGRRLVDHTVSELMHALAFHELGHVFTEGWPIPTTSDNEQAADAFSDWVTVELMHDPGAVLALANYRLALAHFIGIQDYPGHAFWSKASGYLDIARLAAARPGWSRALSHLVPKGYLGREANYSEFAGGPFAGLENALQPIALVPLGG